MIGRRALIGLALAAATATAAGAQQPEPLITDLGEDLISIDSRFTGAKVLLFGTRLTAGDVVVVLRGPREAVVVRRKERTAGLWLNADRAVFEQVPGYYAVAASRPLDQIASPEVLASQNLGVDNLNLRERGDMSAEERQAFRAAMVRNLENQGLYRTEVAALKVIGGNLFRTSFEFPANVPTGRYWADVYLIDDGQVISKRSRALEVVKTGLEDLIFSFANNRPEIYGALAVAIALMAGWLAGVVFRKT